MYAEGDSMDSVALPTLTVVVHTQLNDVFITAVYHTVTIQALSLIAVCLSVCLSVSVALPL